MTTLPTTPAGPPIPGRDVPHGVRRASRAARWGAAAYLYFGVPIFAVAFVVGLVRFA